MTTSCRLRMVPAGLALPVRSVTDGDAPKTTASPGDDRLRPLCAQEWQQPGVSGRKDGDGCRLDVHDPDGLSAVDRPDVPTACGPIGSTAAERSDRRARPWGANWGANASDRQRTSTNTPDPTSRLNSTIPNVSEPRRTLRTSMTRRGSGVQIPHGPLITCVSGVTPRRRSRPTGC